MLWTSDVKRTTDRQMDQPTDYNRMPARQSAIYTITKTY